jgi:RNA polymerase primary sigma factor
LRQVGNLPRLTAREEQFFTQEYGVSTRKIRHLLCQIPVVLCSGLQQLCDTHSSQHIARQLDIWESEQKEQIQSQIRQTLDSIDLLLNNPGPQPDSSTETDAPDLASRIEALLTPLEPRPAFFAACLKELEHYKTLAKAQNEKTHPNQNEKTLSGVEEQRQILPMPLPEFRDLVRQIDICLAEQNDASRSLVEGNLRLVVSIARKYINCSLPLLDLIQEGNLGLVKAVENFDYSRGYRFSTYATYWIRRNITKALTELGRTIRLPSNQVQQLRLISSTEAKLLQKLGHAPSAEEIAAEAHLSPARVRALRKMSQQTISLQGPVSENSDSTIVDMIEDHTTTTPLDQVADSVLKESIFEAIATLKERERDILTKRYGLDGHKAQSLEQIAAGYQLSGERIRQIEIEALRRLRHPTRSKYFEGHHQ